VIRVHLDPGVACGAPLSDSFFRILLENIAKAFNFAVVYFSGFWLNNRQLL
jgi:hypothetical protein